MNDPKPPEAQPCLIKWCGYHYRGTCVNDAENYADCEVRDNDNGD